MSKNEFIPFAKPLIGSAEKAAVDLVLNNHILTHGPRCSEFEELFAEFIGVKHAVTTSSCTTALHLALSSAGIGYGDEVILPSQTHVATAHAIEYCGAKPIFVDVSASTGNIDIEKIVDVISEKSKAILAVHYVGAPCPMKEIQSIAQKNNLMVFEDCAISLGASIDNKKTGSFGLAGCFSFYPSKHITTMEGGMLVTNDNNFAQIVRSKRAFGYDHTLENRKVPGIYDIEMLGYNYRMSEVQAAIGIAQLQKLHSFIQLRIINSNIIYKYLKNSSDLFILPFDHEEHVSSRYCVNVVLKGNSGVDRNNLILKLKDSGIGTSVHYPVTLPLSLYYLNKYNNKSENFLTSKYLSSNTISLPCGPHLSESEAHRVGKTFIEQFDGLKQNKT